ncbi:MAG: hypothetical protein ACRAUW_02265 [Aeromonas sp.]|uniref:hypothetical protein n=1 Tax=Aeromonas sp. TaxID=647 RepID=UPI003D6C03AC
MNLFSSSYPSNTLAFTPIQPQCRFWYASGKLVLQTQQPTLIETKPGISYRFIGN